MKREVDISIIIPLYNEQEVFNSLINRLGSVMEECPFNTEVILIDDGSSDKTRELITEISKSDPQYTALILAKNYGHQMALTAGMKYANAQQGVFIIDGDLQDPPELIMPWYKLIIDNDYDVVYGERELLNQEGFFKKISSRVFYKWLNVFTQERIPLNSGDFCMLSRRAVNILNNMPERHRFMRGLRSSIGLKQFAYSYKRESRVEGESKYSLRKMISLALDGIYGFSDIPYKLMIGSGIGLMFLSITYLVYSLIKSLIWGTVTSGFLGLLSVIILFGGINLLGLGVIGGYVIRNFFEIKKRPLFLVDEIVTDQKSIKPQYSD